MRNMRVWALNLLLVLQAVGFYALARPEKPLAANRLAQIPRVLGPWHLVREIGMDEDTRGRLQPDEYLIRDYRHAGLGIGANLFIAYYRSQRGGRAPHSPKNCLPAHGWVSLHGGTSLLDTGSGRGSITVNRYLVANGEEKAVVLYWYQTAARDVAGEYRAGFYQILDTVRYNRSDTALVRVVAPVEFADEKSVENAAMQFAAAAYPFTREIW